MKKRLHAIVSGNVQGVNYRYFALHWAQQFEVFGFARNTENEEVEVVAEGEEQKLKEFLEKLRAGPSYALVKKVSANWLDATGEFSSFEIIH